AVRGGKLKVGTTQLPASSISRAASALRASSWSQRLLAPRLGRVRAAVRAASRRWWARRGGMGPTPFGPTDDRPPPRFGREQSARGRLRRTDRSLTPPRRGPSIQRTQTRLSVLASARAADAG